MFELNESDRVLFGFEHEFRLELQLPVKLHYYTEYEFKYMSLATILGWSKLSMNEFYSGLDVNFS